MDLVALQRAILATLTELTGPGALALALRLADEALESGNGSTTALDLAGGA